jgi:hypothetical protein
MDVATSSGRRTWRESRRRCGQEADGGRGWIDAGCPRRLADDDDCPRAWIDAGPPLSSYVALLVRDSPSGIGVRMSPSSDKFHDLGSAFFRAGGGGRGR